MKKLIAAVLVSALSFTAYAGGHHGHRHHGHHGHHHGGGHWNWVAPALIGGVIAYEIARPAPQPVIVPQPPRTAYYCSTSGQFYPQTQYCTVPWQQVPY